MLKTTRLEAVNNLLACAGQQPVADLTSARSPDTLMAENTLDETSREVQVRGWKFNTETEYPLTPDVDGLITLPDNIIHCDIDEERFYPLDVVLRGNRLYDQGAKTYVFSSSLSIKADVVYLLDWDELPEHARRFITVRSARRFVERLTGDPDASRFSQRDEAAAYAELQRRETLQGDSRYLRLPIIVKTNRTLL